MRQHPGARAASGRPLAVLAGGRTGLPIATLRGTPQGFGVSHGVTFQPSHDNLDDLVLALLELDDGRRAVLQRHRGLADAGVVERAVTKADYDDPSVLDVILEELGLGTEDVEWSRWGAPGRR